MADSSWMQQPVLMMLRSKTSGPCLILQESTGSTEAGCPRGTMRRGGSSYAGRGIRRQMRWGKEGHMDKKLLELIADLMEEEVIALAKEKIQQGVDPMSILDEARSAMEVVGKRFENGQYFIPDLMMAGEILREISEIVKPYLAKVSGPKKISKIIM